jgi:hypothetical protein
LTAGSWAHGSRLALHFDSTPAGKTRVATGYAAKAVDIGRASTRDSPVVFVRFALRLPHTFYVLSGLMLFLGVTAILVNPTTSFQISTPCRLMIWQYNGLSP